MAGKELISADDFSESIGLKKLKMATLAPALMKLLKLKKVNKLYEKNIEQHGVEFAEAILKELGVAFEFNDEELKNLPANEPFVVVSNHPYGGIDGLMMIALLARVRPDLKIMANYLLQQIKPLEQYFVSVDPFDKKKGNDVNLRGIKNCMQLLRNGNPVVVFPAGEVSSLKVNNLKISDKVWNPVVGKLILKSNVRVVPLYFSGYNSLLFNLLGLLHPALRTARLPSELFNKKKDKVVIRIGKPVSLKTIEAFKDPNDLMRYLRAKTYALGSGLDVHDFFGKRILPVLSKPIPVITETPRELIMKEIDSIKPRSLLFTHENFEVFISGARFIPNILREISRLREITFRQVGEGTNRSYDADEYDLNYKHLFIWDARVKLIVGAYRIGVGDVLYRRYKKEGFYLNELFKISSEFTPILKQSLELGRSFIREEYQKKPFSLMLLWKGINEFIKREDNRFQYLIGPVSISNSFSSLSKDLLVDFIRQHHYDTELANMVKPRKRFKFQHKGEGKELRNSKVSDIKLLDQIISEIEVKHTKVPVLLKKYLKQNAKIIAFNIDPKFNHSLDGFLVMKLTDIPKDTFDLIN
jgi:putative hemolysin